MGQFWHCRIFFFFSKKNVCNSDMKERAIVDLVRFYPFYFCGLHFTTIWRKLRVGMPRYYVSYTSSIEEKINKKENKKSSHPLLHVFHQNRLRKSLSYNLHDLHIMWGAKTENWFPSHKFAKTIGVLTW